MTIFHVLKYPVSPDGYTTQELRALPEDLWHHYVAERERMYDAYVFSSLTPPERAAFLVSVIMEWDGPL